MSITVTNPANGSSLSAAVVRAQMQVIADAIGDPMQVSVYDPDGVEEQVIGETAVQTMTNKTLTTPTIIKPVMNATNPTAVAYTPGTGSQTVTINCATSNQHDVVGNAGGTDITFAVSNATNNQVFMVSITQGASTLSTIVAWFATVRWAGGTPPTLTATANKRDRFAFIRTGTNTYDGFIIGQNI